MDNPYINTVTRIMFMKVPIDIVPADEVEKIVLDLAERGQLFKLVFLTYRDFTRARRDPEYLAYLKDAALVLPVSKSLENGCGFLKLPLPVRHHPFSLIIRILGILEQKRLSFYLLGGTHREVQTIADNLRTSFPQLKNVGRHAGFFPREKESTIVTAIQKSTPSLLLVGPGVPGKDKWIFRNSQELNVKLAVWSAEAFAIMSLKKQRPDAARFAKSGEPVGGSVLNPLKWLRAFSYIWYGILLIFYRLFK